MARSNTTDTEVTEGNPALDTPVIEPAPAAAEVLTVDGEVYATRGRTHVAAPHGYAFSVPGLPLIDEAGILVTKDEANVLFSFAEKNGVTLSVTTSTEKED